MRYCVYHKYTDIEFFDGRTRATPHYIGTFSAQQRFEKRKIPNINRLGYFILPSFLILAVNNAML